MGVEGAAARVYFDVLQRLLPDDSGFTGRRRRPPKDPVNAALGYAYAVLLGEAVSAVSVVGLDPVAGFLHDDSERRPSLGLDLMEEFRPLLVDSVVVELFRRRRLRGEDHFRPEGRGIYLNQPGRAVLLSAFEDRMLTLFHHLPSGKRVTYRRALTLQAHQIAAVLEGRSAEYEPVPWR
jgi:CRISPR-associated protein Cas1